MPFMLLKGVIAGCVVIAVSLLAPKYPRIGALVLTLPLVSILAFVGAWTKQKDLPAIVALAKETLILVPLGLPFFVPLAFADRWGLAFWPALAIGFALAATTIGLYFLWAA